MAQGTAAPKSKFPPLLHFTYNLQHLADELLVGEVGIGLGQARILSGLSSSASRSQRHLAAELNQTESNVSRQLKVMKKHGLVNVSRNKKDGRQRDVTLTAKGARLSDRAQKVLKGQQRSFLRMLNRSEVDLLESAANKMAR